MDKKREDIKKLAYKLIGLLDDPTIKDREGILKEVELHLLRAINNVYDDINFVKSYNLEVKKYENNRV